MTGIVSYGAYIPWYRITYREIAKAWKLPPQEGEKAVPAIDEDSFVIAFKAARKAVENSEAPEVVYLATISSPYIERSLATSIAFGVGSPPSVAAADFGASQRATSLAMLACMDAISSGRIERGLVVGSDALVGAPGTELDIYSGAGSSAILLAKNGIAEIEGFSSYSTDFTDRWRNSQSRYPRTGDSRFIRDYGYVSHIVSSAKKLMEKLALSPKDFSHVVLQQSHPRWIRDAARKIGFSYDQLKLGSTIQKFGDTGCASILLGLSSILDEGNPGERILLSSYGSGGSDSFSIVIKERAKKKMVKDFENKKEYIDYFTYLRHNKIIRREW
jgi:hydroxymethylglutaryl-CoA synthase